MNIVDFENHHIEEATALALDNYQKERRFVGALPKLSPVHDLTQFAENGLGVAAFEGGRMIGFLCCYEPFDHAFRSTDVKGVFSPMGANASVSENRSQIYAAMYQAAGAKWVRAGAVSHAVCLYAHDEELQRQFFRYGFGLRCVDAIRLMEPIDCEPCGGYEFFEASAAECHLIYPLDLALYRHYRSSPFFMNRTPETAEEFETDFRKDDVRYFAARKNGKLCAHLKISSTGETSAAAGNTYRHITGAYCLPEHRGIGVYQNLLNFVISTLKREGYSRLGVDFESINPVGSRFWLKYFSPYTSGVVRRIDERITQCMG